MKLKSVKDIIQNTEHIEVYYNFFHKHKIHKDIDQSIHPIFWKMWKFMDNLYYHIEISEDAIELLSEMLLKQINHKII